MSSKVGERVKEGDLFSRSFLTLRIDSCQKDGKMPAEYVDSGRVLCGS
jgi:hypothetical protein